ncbi:hypothetical protein RUM43_011721 [Polyplax serrata]|uniref:Uncharacterized protein n=1 Tax=Polyplax serrata TaxID=468196 RepID=A0AAN8S7C7_POLSC
MLTSRLGYTEKTQNYTHFHLVSSCVVLSPLASLGSPDSQYGFSSTVEGAPYTVIDPRTPPGMPVCPPALPGADITEGGFYSWGPPPPYASNRNSANNSPARRSLGELLHQVSPVRRNDNVSPVRNSHHIHRHHVHHSRRCASSPRQMTNTSHQSDTYQKSNLQRNSTSIANIPPSEQQPGMNAFWSNSLSSVHPLQKIISNKDNYENMLEPENSSTNGFNTLPSLKKKNQTRAADVFQNESFTAYFFSSAENLGCSTSNIGPATFHSENFPRGVPLPNDQPNTSRHDPLGCSTSDNATKNSPEMNMSSGVNQSMALYGGDVISAGPRTRHLRPVERNALVAKQLLSSSSPGKQKPKLPHDPQHYSSIDNKSESLNQTPRKLTGKKFGESEEAGKENVLTFHYRVGIPRSPNIQNFSQLPEKSAESYYWSESGKDGSGSELWSNERTSGSEMSQSEGQKPAKAMKCHVRDIELIQKHNSLMNEFKSLDLGRNLKYKSNNKVTGIENGAFQPSEDTEKDVKELYRRNFQGDGSLELTPRSNYSGQSQEQRPSKMYSTNDSINEEYLDSTFKSNENESDVYFGDASNSSCYGPESLSLDERPEEAAKARLSATGHSLLSKQNVKMVGLETYNEVPPAYDIHLDGKQQHHSEATGYKKYVPGYHQTRGVAQLSENNSSDDFSSSAPTLVPVKTPKRSGAMPGGHYKPADSKGKYFNPVSVRGVKDVTFQYEEQQQQHHHHPDSGISTGRSYPGKPYEVTYNDVDYRLTEPASESNRSNEIRDGCFDMSGVLPGKMIHFETLGDFAHPLFQKPKVLPRGTRYSKVESRARGSGDSETDFDGDGTKPRNRTVGNVAKVKSPPETVEEISNQLLSSLTLSPRYLNDESRHAKTTLETDDDLSVQKENHEEMLRRSPKPLPRSNVTGQKTSSEQVESDHGQRKTGRNATKKEKPEGHFLAPDAQYEYQANYKPDGKLKTSQNPTRSKPPVSARPLHLQVDGKKSGKVPEGSSPGGIQVVGSRPTPRRRRNGLEGPDVTKDIEIGTHSVNV